MNNLQDMYRPTENDNNKNFLLYTPAIGILLFHYLIMITIT